LHGKSRYPIKKSHPTEERPIHLSLSIAALIPKCRVHLHAGSLSEALTEVLNEYLGDNIVEENSSDMVIAGTHDTVSDKPCLIIDLAPGGNESRTLVAPFGPSELFAAISNIYGTKECEPIMLVRSPLHMALATQVPCHVLVAEDNKISSELLKKIVLKCGAECSTARNGEECVLMYKSSPQRYNLVLMDVCMPVMDGVEAMKQIRMAESELASGHRIPIYAVTANAMLSDEEKCIRAGRWFCSRTSRTS
jgi:CheY-like chemotaxis protein